MRVLGATYRGLVCPWLVLSLLGACLLAGSSARGEILWRSPGWQLIRENKGGTNLLEGKVPPHDDTFSGTLFFKFQVDPISDYVVENPGFYEAGLVLYESGQQRLGIGNAWYSAGYSAFNVSSTNPQNATLGEFNLNSSRPEFLKSGPIEVPRYGLVRTIVFKVKYVPGEDDDVTVWLTPNLWRGATELNQGLNKITRFKANASFDELRLVHRGAGKGWRFADLAVATKFEDFVEPYPWEKAWIISAGVLCLTGVVAGGLWARERRRASRLRRERERLEVLNAIERERRRIAQDIHDDLGATLWEIQFLSKLAQDMEGGVEKTRQDLELIAAKALEGTRALDETVWAVDPGADSLESFVNYACAFATEYLELTITRCRMDLPTNLPPLPLRADTRHGLFLAFKECLTNVVKHAQASEVQIRMALNGSVFSIEVTDNGKGMPPEDLAGSDQAVRAGHHGLRNMRARVAALGGTCQITSTPGQGTKLTMQIQLQPDGKADAGTPPSKPTD